MNVHSRWVRIRNWSKWDVVIPLLALALIIGLATGISTWKDHQCTSHGGHMAWVHLGSKTYTCVGRTR